MHGKGFLSGTVKAATTFSEGDVRGMGPSVHRGERQRHVLGTVL
jgi:hypothetical protein